MNYTSDKLCKILEQLISFPQEMEWIEFKHNNTKPETIGENLSALANSAILCGQKKAYIVWGINNHSHEVVGTDFCPRQEKVGKEELENWLNRLLEPGISFSINEFTYHNKDVVMIVINNILFNRPVKFKGEGYLRVGSYTKKLKDFPEKERELWLVSSRLSFEEEIAEEEVSADRVLLLIDYPSYFELSQQSLPDNRSLILDRLLAEDIITKNSVDGYNITNLGVVLFAKKLADFKNISRKAVRVIIYKGLNKIETLKEHIDGRGYANSFQSIISYIIDQIPQNERIEHALRREIKMYPDIAIRELVANAIIHQDFNVTGSSPMVEIYSDRIEITNYGRTLIDSLRLIDEPPRSRNESLAGFMRKLNICEERGSGMKKLIASVEEYQLPAPEIIVTENHTKVILYSHKQLAAMSSDDKARACYQHACLRYVSNSHLTNASLRDRFTIDKKNSAQISRIIKMTVNKDLIKEHDPESKSRKYVKYVPFWV